MANHGLIVGLDVGTNTIKVLAADVRDQQANIVAVGRSITTALSAALLWILKQQPMIFDKRLHKLMSKTSTPVTEVVSLPCKQHSNSKCQRDDNR